MRLKKTEQKLLARKRDDAGRIWCEGIREANAARSLVLYGLASRYVSRTSPAARRSGLGETYYDHFSRSYKTYRPHTVICGELFFDNPQ